MPEVNSQNISATITLNARLQPSDRDELEDALAYVMEERGLAFQVTGGGSSISASGEILECDIEVEFSDQSGQTPEIIAEALEAMLAPRGSSIQIPAQNKRIDFGVHEGLGLYLNGTDLPQEVYEGHDANDILDECDELLDGIGQVSSHWTGPEETALYIYGDDFQAMRERLSPLLNSHPLCQKCRVEQIA